jgi:tRNA G18 (ribose-2'-O)-methylase SpoU
MPQFPIDDIADPRLEVYRDLPQRNLTRHSGRFIAEGEKLAQRLIESSFDVESVLVEPALAERFERRLPESTPLYVLPKPLLMETVGFHFHRGVMACGRRRAGPAIADLLAPPKVTFVICESVQDPTNLGGIIRTAAAFGCSALIAGSHCADSFSRRVLRVSMGAALTLPIVESRDLAADLGQLTASGVEIVATVLDPAAEPLDRFQRADRTAILLGSEGHGLPEQWLALCQRRLTIPMAEGIDSLNVSVAAAVVLWQLTR